jgi:hypothetical protein
MHTHLLAPKKFSDDIKSNPRYSALAGLVDFPLTRLLDKIRRLDHDNQVSVNVGQWHRKFRQLPYDLITVNNSGPIFPPSLSLSRIIINAPIQPQSSASCQTPDDICAENHIGLSLGSRSRRGLARLSIPIWPIPQLVQA